MTEDQKRLANKLRQQGQSYAQIATVLGVPKNTVKTHCWRNNIAAPVGSKPVKSSFCQNCGKPIKQPEHIKTKKYCNDKCRITWWNHNRNLLNSGATRQVSCAYCGSKFEKYEKSGQRFCSHACYTNLRFKKGGCH